VADGATLTEGWTAVSNGLPDTLPKLLERNAREFGARPAMREKDLGIWQSWSWAEAYDEVRKIAAGLAAIGVSRGDRVAVIGDNRPQLYWSMCAAQMLGAVPVPAYPDSATDELAFVIGRAEVDVAVVEDQEQVDKLLAVREKQGGHPAQIIYKDSRGLRHYTHPGLIGLDDLAARGASFLAAHPGAIEDELAKGRGADISVILFTSGTAGHPKGVALTYNNVIVSAANAVRAGGLTASDEVLAYLPMAWVGDHILSYAESFVAGFCLSCPESGATAITDLREIGPTFFFAPPRIFETILTSVSVRMGNAGRLKRRMHFYFMDVARRVGAAILDGRPVSPRDRLLYRLGEILIYGPIKNALGLSRMRLGYTVGEAIGPDTLGFYRSLGLNLKQLYGTTETSMFVCLQPNGKINPDAVGTPAPQVEVRIADSGEVLVRSPGAFPAYYRDERATAEAKTADGWVRTGDIGRLGTDGQLRIIDRAENVGRLNCGTAFAPKYLENKLKFFPYIKEAVTFGNGRDYAAAIINIDAQALGGWAERQGLPYASYQELASKPEVYDLIQGCVEQVNRDLGADATFAGTQIKRFLILHKELDADDGELTRTRKLRRSVIAKRYAPLIDALYGTEDRAHISTTVAFEDGRQAKIEADLAVREAARAMPSSGRPAPPSRGRASGPLAGAAVVDDGDEKELPAT
jgi:long-chain acyl-CoA synthetase